jgi:hypothetical protein
MGPKKKKELSNYVNNSYPSRSKERLFLQIRFPGSNATRQETPLIPPKSMATEGIFLTRPFCAAIRISLSSPVACSSSVGTPPKEKHVSYNVN